MENKKTKRYYSEGEIIWVISEKREGKVLNINKEDLEVTVQVKDKVLTLKVWEIDKIKYKAKEKLETKKKKNKKLPTVYFAKVRPDAIIPSKRDEDAGYDIYANLETTMVTAEDGTETEGKAIFLPKNRTTLVPTGIAMAMPKTHFFNTKRERGSTGKISMSVLSGVIDSGYRGEVFIALTPLYKDILITTEVTEVQEFENGILYPYSKAICQGTVELVPQVNIEEITFEELQNIESERKASKLGESGK